MEVRITHGDGRPAAGALVSVAAAPVDLTELALVADDQGGVHIPAEAPGLYRLNVWIDGECHRSSHEVVDAQQPLSVRLTR